MLQQPKSDDYVMATGITTTIREMCEIALQYLGLSHKDSVVIDLKYFRPTEMAMLLGNSGKALKALGWKPNKSLQQLITIVADADMRRLIDGIG